MFKKKKELVIFESSSFENYGECMFEAGFFLGKLNGTLRYFKTDWQVYYQNRSWNPFKEQWVFEIVLERK